MMSIWNSLVFNSFCWRMCSNGSDFFSTHLPSPCSGHTQARLLAAPGSWFTCVTEVWTPHHTASCWTRYCPATIFCKIEVGQDVQRSLHVCTILVQNGGVDERVRLRFHFPSRQCSIYPVYQDQKKSDSNFLLLNLKAAAVWWVELLLHMPRCFEHSGRHEWKWNEPTCV